MDLLKNINGKPCDCGKEHVFPIDSIVSGKGVITQIASLVTDTLGCKKPYVVSDIHTYAAAGEQVCRLLADANVPYVSFVFPQESLEPDERTLGSAAMRMTADCDCIIGVGSGVINDTCKILSNISGKPYIIVATAPSMDGYASLTSSVTRDGLKISLPSRAADIILGDTDILCQAPAKLMKSGLGDMLAKYVSITEWRISHLINGEYYCETIADLIRQALKRCTDNADGLLARDPAAVEAVFEGLVIGGVAMNYAGVSRPASGGEHYLSHVWDMRAAEFGTPMDLHGIQCAIGTLISAKLYDKVKTIIPDREKALAYVKSFDTEAWNETLRDFLGRSAESMIALEKKEGKYDVSKHEARLDRILANWDGILAIVEEELPPSAEIERILTVIDAPKTMEDIGLSSDLLPLSFQATKDIRDKYVLSRLLWDLGVIEEMV